MKQDARLIAKGHWGTNRPAFSLALTGERVLADAAKYGRVQGLRTFEEKTSAASSRTSDTEKSPPVGFSFVSVFPSVGINQKTGWSKVLGGTDYLEQLANPFTGNVPGLAHTADTAGSYLSNPISGGEWIEANTSHTLRLYLHKAPASVSFPLLIANWDNWDFQINKSGAILQRRAATWAQGDETALIALLGVENPTTLQQDSIAALKRSLYEDSADIQLDGDRGQTFGEYYELEFVPDAKGHVTVFCNGKWAGQCVHTPILKSRLPGVLWSGSSLGLRRNGGHFIWQCGYPQFGTSGEIQNPFRATNDNGGGYYVDGLPAMQFTLLKHEPAGTTITASLVPTDSVNAVVRIAFSSSNSRVTPLLYAAQGHIDAGERNGSTETAWDSDDHRDDDGNAPILEIEPSCEGEFRRGQFNVRVRDVQGALFTGLGSLYQTLEHRIINLEIGGQAVLTGGIVRRATISDWGSTLPNQVRSQVARPDTTLQMELCDPWTLLEEFELEGRELVGDGLRLGSLLRRALRLIGTPYGEMNGVSAAAGRILPKAAPGEDWAVVSTSGSLAAFIHSLIEKFGMGWILWRTPGGAWVFGKRPTTTRVLGGHAVEFSSDPARNHPDTFPGRFAMLRPIDMPREADSFYNVFRVVGQDAASDEPLVRDAVVQESITRGLGPVGSRKFIGRRKKMRTVEDSSLRTADDVQYVLRSLREAQAYPPRYLSFETYFHSGLFISDRVKADGGDYIVRRIGGGSWKDDKMNLLLQEVGY